MKVQVLVTRAEDQAAEFAEHLKTLGLEAVIFPVIEFAPPTDEGPVLSAIEALPSYDWLLLTSANSVKFFLHYLNSTADIKGLKICAVGPKTAEYAADSGLKIDLIPEQYQAEGVLKAFKEKELGGKRILFPRAEEGREILPTGLRELGAEVTLLPVYRTVAVEGKEEELEKILREGLDVITFTSGSTVRSFISILGEGRKERLKGVKIACISRVTANVAEKLGLETDIIPEKNTTLSLAGAINSTYAGFR